MTIESPEPFDYKAPRLRANKRLHGDCAIEGCIFPHIPSLPLCEDHARAVWAEVNGWEEAAEASAKAEQDRLAWKQQWADQARARVEATKANLTGPGTIYYLQVEDEVKIGFTRDLNTRIQSYPPMARLLATHPGTFQLEAEMHRKFARHLADRKEWFKANNELTAHIEHVRNTFKQNALVAA